MKIEKVVFIETNRSFDLSGPIKLTKFREFIYSKMENKMNASLLNALCRYQESLCPVEHMYLSDEKSITDEI